MSTHSASSSPVSRMRAAEIALSAFVAVLVGAAVMPFVPILALFAMVVAFFATDRVVAALRHRYLGPDDVEG